MYRVFILASVWACTLAGTPCNGGSHCRATPAGRRADVLLAIKHHITVRNPDQALKEEGQEQEKKPEDEGKQAEKPDAGEPENDGTKIVPQSEMDNEAAEEEQAEKPDAGEPYEDQTKVATQGTSDQVREPENDGTKVLPQSEMDNEAVEDEMPGAEEYQDAHPKDGEPWVPDHGEIEAGASEAEEIKLMYQEEYCGYLELADCEKHYRENWETLCVNKPMLLPQEVCDRIKIHITKEDEGKPKEQGAPKPQEPKSEEPKDGEKEQDKMLDAVGEQAEKLDAGEQEDKKPDDEGEQAEKPDVGELEDEKPKDEGEQDEEAATQSNLIQVLSEEKQHDAGEAEEIKLMYQEEYCGDMELENCEKHYRANWETLCVKKPVLLPQEVCDRIKILIPK